MQNDEQQNFAFNLAYRYKCMFMDKNYENKFGNIRLSSYMVVRL